MIVDRVENWGQYGLGAAWRSAFEFLRQVRPDAPEDRYPIQGEEVYALVIAADTRPREDALFEAHRRYVDIHVPLLGADGIEWAPVEGLAVHTPYDESSDAALYKMPQRTVGRVDAQPGIFVALFPQDAHAPQLMVRGAPEIVKKVVVKVKVELLEA
jgi:YhcH/YjgK/YiaL family protein